ncbi:unnamed protein product [Amoebophrya sp. A120]|nr:unnamed protein product [Amoebophrya sp. A120]|eukprot:GSA120T00005063001.1
MDLLRSKLADNTRFLILGRAGVDFYPDPPGSKTEHSTNFVAHLGGSAANIAVALAKHRERRPGIECCLLTTVSDDALGRLALHQLRAYGVNAECVNVATGDRDARISLAVVETTLGTDHQSIIYRNHAADLLISSEHVWEAFSTATELEPSKWGCLVATGTSLALEPSRSATLTALRLAKARGIPAVLDVDYRPYTWKSAAEASQVYRKAACLCDIVVGNEAEFAVVAGPPETTSTTNSPTTANVVHGGVAEVKEGSAEYGRGMRFAKLLVSSGACLMTVFKMGQDGSVSFVNNRKITSASSACNNPKGLQPEELLAQKIQAGAAGDSGAGLVQPSAPAAVPPLSVDLEKEVVDELKIGVFEVSPLKPTGAGDAFMGNLLAHLVDEEVEIKEALRRASAAAAIVVTRVGCAPAMPSPEELQAFLETAKERGFQADLTPLEEGR